MAETVETILIRHKRELEALLKAGDEESMLPVLQGLSARHDITVALLSSTKIGKRVNAIEKSATLQPVKSAAQELLHKWKALVDAWLLEPASAAALSNTTQCTPAAALPNTTHRNPAAGPEAPNCAVPLFDPNLPRIKFDSKSADAQVKSLSNFADLPVTINGCNYATGEHAFHGRKYTEAASATSCPLRREKLLTHARKFVQGGAVAKSGLDAKRAGGKGKAGLLLDPTELHGWAEASVAVQNCVCEYKFSKYPQVRRVLEQSGHCELLHQNNRAKHSEIWGGRVDSVTSIIIGSNQLGRIWMQLRQREFPDSTSTKSTKRPREQQAAGGAPAGQLTPPNPKRSVQNPRNRSDEPFASRYAVTFGEVAILHVGGQEFGTKRDEGFSVGELREVAKTIVEAGGVAELVMVSDALPEELRQDHEAATLVIRQGASFLLKRSAAADALLREHATVAYDKQFWHSRQKKTMNKQARYNVVFGPEGIAHNDSFEQPTVHAISQLPLLNEVRLSLPKLLGTKAEDLYAEGNHYYQAKSGIGFHGDAERKIVICLSLGSTSVLRYQWRKPGDSTPFGPPVDLTLNHGDMYVMSEKATGGDWMKRSQYRVVHGAGSNKYIGQGYA